MPRHFLRLALFLLIVGSAVAQDADFRDDLKFAETLRNRGDSDLALEYLQKLARSAPPELIKELPLEFAKTRLRVAGDEPETGKRLALYKEARDDFQKFIAANPGHPRLAEANLDIARVLNLQGKTELNRAFLAEDSKSKRDASQQARTTLEEAAKQLEAAVKALGADKETELKQTKLEQALNLYDQADTYISGSGDEAASKLLTESGKILRQLGDGEVKDPIKWKATAWLGRVVHRIDTADNARAKFQEVLNAGEVPSAAEGIRLARYFRLLVIQEQPSDVDKKAAGGPNAIIIEAANRWRSDYRRYLKTPEGLGLTFLLADTLLKEADFNKKLSKGQGDRYRIDARALLREVENSENEFTERARRRKIEAIARLGTFKAPLKNLRTFEDFYIRSQYEAMQMVQEQKETKDAEEAEKKRKARIDTIIQALQMGLALPEVKKLKASIELNNARSMMAYWALNTGKLAEAIQAGETFAREDPRSSQAEMSAVYALQAYSQLLTQKQGKFDEAAAEDRSRMLSLASYMEERWPRSIGGDLARHSIGLQLLREENFPEAIKKLGMISPNYGNYPLVCFQIADICNKADKASVEPIAGDRAGDYRKRAMLALEAMPDSALGGDPVTNQVVVSGKAMLGRDLFRYKRFQQMDDLAGGLLDKINKLRFNEEEDKDRSIRNQLRYELVDIRLFARYGLADTAFQAGDFARVLALLDPLVDAASKGDENQEKTNLQKNQQLGSALLILALRSNIQLGKIDRTDIVLDLLDKVSGEGGGDTTNLLKLLAFLIRGQIDEIRKKGDKEALATAVKGYTAILDKRIKRQKSPSPDFIRVLAGCYSSMEEHGKAAEELTKLMEARGKGGPDDEKLQKQIQIDLIRELRLTKDVEHLKKARGMMGTILGTQQKPGWGRRDLAALKEEGNLLEAEEKYSEGFALWADLTKRLARGAQEGGAKKENYLECYYHMIFCYVKMGLAKAGQEERDKFLKTAALQIAQLERSWEEFGSEASKKRFTELLAQEAALLKHYEAIKKK